MEMALSIFQVIVCLAIVILVLCQESPKGTSGALTGSGDTDTQYDKIKGRTGSAILKKITVVLGVLLAVSTFVINIL
ncbi:MAG: preprotein translocase subunit SecG [Clostridia bacterium]